jgi:ADP-heptose:LPS heptosyltransferase
MTPSQLILLVRTGRMGDMAMFTSTLQAVIEACPAAEFHLVTSVEGDRVLRGYHPRLTRTLVYSRSLFRSFGARRAVRRLLGENRYDRALVFESNPHYHELFSDAADRVDLLRDPTRSHRVEHEIEVLERAGLWKGAAPWPSLGVTERGQAAARALLARHGIGEETVVVGLHPTSGYLGRVRLRRDRLRHRAWPTGSFAELARFLDRHAAEHGAPLRAVIDVLPEERRYAAEIQEKAGGLVTIIDAPPDFDRYKAMLQRMQLLVTIDTGPMHVAAALGTPMVALFSDTDPDVIGPFMPADRYVVLHADDTPDPSPGMAAISAPSVFEACLSLLPPGRAGMSGRERT